MQRQLALVSKGLKCLKFRGYKVVAFQSLLESKAANHSFDSCSFLLYVKKNQSKWKMYIKKGYNSKTLKPK